jgi:hypothetical protein|tara:strand:+ start:2164 stop:2562 length:399 start_codon:yes stop_codon:yes gene_type:complete
MITLSLITAAADTTLYRCQRNSVPEFSDRPCRGAHSRSIPLPAINLVRIPELNADEQARLDTLANAARLPGNQSSRSKHGTRLAARREACAEAEKRLEAIREQRRRGYSLKDAAALDARTSALMRDVRRYCR